ncbi:hypothetical protein ACFOD4_11495 [Pseudoroseomonas globiformis]|uniref:Uncharacterized protein n=1 Tax=Teichococcus globiformis TaxID=2307229 RepID=A0ABV7G2I1_9PROT
MTIGAAPAIARRIHAGTLSRSSASETAMTMTTMMMRRHAVRVLALVVAGGRMTGMIDG